MSIRSLRQRFISEDPVFLMEAHSGLAAKIVQQEGFDGIWASGLSIASAHGVRDCNELSWTQILEILESMRDAAAVPILVDGDTGFGDFNNVRRLVRKLCRLGINGVCIEDKLYPKRNSYIGACQPLADTDEFCGKIKAAKDSQSDDDFAVVARVEALVSGLGLDAALTRAERYREAGADAILIHSKQKCGDEILAFARRWSRRAPLVIVPTTYYSTPVATFHEAGISTIIWANHNLRASLRAMQLVSRSIRALNGPSAVENSITSLTEIFELLGYRELEEAEQVYLPRHETRVPAPTSIFRAPAGAVPPPGEHAPEHADDATLVDA
jgi:phosphoenolpyruvate mutase